MEWSDVQVGGWPMVLENSKKIKYTHFIEQILMVS